MTDMINDRLDELDELRGLGEDDEPTYEAAEDKKAISPFTGRATQSKFDSSEADNLRDLVSDDEPVAEAVEDKKVVSSFTGKATQSKFDSSEADNLRDLVSDDEPTREETISTEKVGLRSISTAKIDSEETDDLRDLGEEDESVAEEPVSILKTETGEDEQTDEVVSIAKAPVVEEKQAEKPVLASEAKAEKEAPVAHVSKTEVTLPELPETKLDEKPAFTRPQAVVATTEPKSEVKATPVSASMTSGGELIFNPTFSLRVFLFMRYLFIRFFDAILTGVAIVIEQTVALYETGIFGKIVSPFRAGSSAINSRMPDKFRKAFYAVVAILCFGLSSSYVFALFATAGKPVNRAPAQVANVSYTNTKHVNQDIIAQVFTPTVQSWAGEIETWTSGTVITAHMLATVMQFESCGNPGAQAGLFGVGDSNNTPDAQASLAIEKLQSALSMSDGHLPLALAIYAEGEQILAQDFTTWTLHTRDMFMIASTVYNQAESAYTSSPDLNSWLQNSGAILCTDTVSLQNG